MLINYFFMLPRLIKPLFWSYKFSKLDVHKHQQTIIKQIMEYGTMPMISWLFKTYKKNDLKKCFKQCRSGDLSPKSKNFWQLVLKI